MHIIVPYPPVHHLCIPFHKVSGTMTAITGTAMFFPL